jgi:hypothetical protein
MKLTFPLPLPRLFNDPGRCARVAPGLLRAWVPARVMVAQDLGPRLMVGVPTDLRPIAERQCYPEGVSLAADLRWRLRYSPLGIRLFGHRSTDRQHPPCRWCGFYADAAPAPPYDTTVVEVLLAGGVRRRGETCWGRQQTLHGVWLAGWCGRPEHPEIAPHDAPAAFVAGFDWVDGEGRTEAVSLCRACADDWRYGTVFDPEDLGRHLGASVQWLR